VGRWRRWQLSLEHTQEIHLVRPCLAQRGSQALETMRQTYSSGVDALAWRRSNG